MCKNDRDERLLHLIFALNVEIDCCWIVGFATTFSCGHHDPTAANASAAMQRLHGIFAPLRHILCDYFFFHISLARKEVDYLPEYVNLFPSGYRRSF